MSSLNEEEEKFDGIEDTQSETVSSRGYKRKRTSGAEAVMTEVVSVLAHLKNRNEEKPSVQENDEDAIFGQYITLEMKKIQDRRKKVQNTVTPIRNPVWVCYRYLSIVFNNENGMTLYQSVDFILYVEIILHAENLKFVIQYWFNNDNGSITLRYPPLRLCISHYMSQKLFLRKLEAEFCINKILPGSCLL